MKKKLLVVLLAIFSVFALAFGLTACSLFGGKNTEPQYEKISGSEGLEYTLSNNGEYYICSGMGTCTQTEITIASWYNDKYVTEIGYNAFYNCISLKSVTIPDSVTSIGDRAFYDCTGLTEINYNATECANLSYDNEVFYKAGQSGTGITVTIGANVKKIPAYLFYQYSYSSHAPKITSVVFEEGSVCECIGDRAFYQCSSFTSITIPDSVTSIGSSAFYDCTGLTEINYNATECANLSYDNEVFYKAGQSGTGITVTIGANVKKIPAYLFYPYNDSSYAPKITSVVFEEGSVCESIGNSAFSSCSSLTSITIPNSVTSIGYGAFEDCSSLTSITIPNSVTSIGDWAFERCSSLMRVTIGNSVTSIGDRAFVECSNLTSVTIPTSVTSIGNSAFGGCSNLTSVTFGENSKLTSIGNSAFYWCSSLTGITIPDSVTSIGNSAFEGCSSLTSVTIPASVTSIGERAFYNCSRLKSVTIGNSVTSIGSSAFYKCSKLTSVTFENTSGWWYVSSSTATSGTSISSTDLANPSTAATYLTSTYDNYYWKRS